MLIRVSDLRITGDKFSELVRQQMKDNKLSQRKAYFKVVESLEELGFGYPYQSFQSFQNKYYQKG